MKRLFVLVAVALVISACGGDSGGPIGPSTPPSSQTFTLGGSVTETAPTTATKIAGATIAFTDGGNAGKSATTDGAGNYSLAGLVAGGFTTRTTAAGYVERSQGVTIETNTTLSVALDPVPQILTSRRDETISGGDACVGGPNSFGDACKQYTLDVHHSGMITSSVTWPDRDTWLWLELYRMADGQQLAQAQTSRTVALRQEISVNVPARAQYLIRVRWVFGARITPFSLTVTRPN